ncbi:adhesion G protein-coupled receptor B2 [Trichonephila clavipes]|nr:adhesion G protein-coupled receptor B2 [Trichonephila clavipes]
MVREEEKMILFLFSSRLRTLFARNDRREGGNLPPFSRRSPSLAQLFTGTGWEKGRKVVGPWKYDFWHRTATDVVQSGRPIFDDFFQHLWPYIGNNTANVVFQMVKRLWLIRIDQ